MLREVGRRAGRRVGRAHLDRALRAPLGHELDPLRVAPQESLHPARHDLLLEQLGHGVEVEVRLEALDLAQRLRLLRHVRDRVLHAADPAHEDVVRVLDEVVHALAGVLEVRVDFGLEGGVLEGVPLLLVLRLLLDRQHVLHRHRVLHRLLLLLLPRGRRVRQVPPRLRRRRGRRRLGAQQRRALGAQQRRRRPRGAARARRGAAGGRPRRKSAA